MFRFFRFINIFVSLLIFCFIINISELRAASNTYPKKANYFLKWTIANHEVPELAKWDLLILDMEVQENSRANLKKIRQLNPDIIILAYITSQEANANIYQSEWSREATLRKKLIDNIIDGWWLKNNNSHRTSFWPGTYLLNLSNGAKTNSAGQRWNDFLPEFVKREIISTGLWDGIFYDNIWGDITWASANIDINNEGQVRPADYIDRAWSDGVKKMLQKTRQLLGSQYLILGNGKVFSGYQNLLNGVMFEGFPAQWESSGNWGEIISTYSRIKDSNNHPNVTVINSYNSNRHNYQAMRYGLASTLMESHGYFSFDFSNESHGQLWWYDEYDNNLGQAQSAAYNLLDRSNSNYKNGLWRRDFSEGIVLVNSTKQEQLYVFKQEEFQKINGSQDRSVNNGTIVNYVKLKPEDGLILIRRSSSVGTIRNSAFNNGDFIRVFDRNGHQSRAGFFAYLDAYPANSQIIVTDIDNDGQDETLVNYRGVISIYRNNRKIREFKPYEGMFKGEISLAVADLNGDRTKEIITGAGQGGGPHVRVFDNTGRPLIGGFFAYDKNFRGGVRVAVMDLDGDGTQEIITAAGIGGGPHIRVFNKDGRPLIGGFFAYDKNFRGGVSLAVGDIDGDGQREIITAPGPGGRPEVKIFDKDGRLMKSFLAYEDSFRSGLRVMTDDLDKDNISDILVGSISF